MRKTIIISSALIALGIAGLVASQPAGARAGPSGAASRWSGNFAVKTILSLVASGGGGEGPREEHEQMEASSPEAVESGYAPVNGLRIYYEIRGEGPPLVLLHGGGSTIGTSFGKVLEPLAKHRRVIAFEQQGHGRTADIDRPFSFEQSADDAAALLRHLGVERADFYGYSNGGSIALQMGIRHPGLVRKLVVASTMYRNDGLPPGFKDSLKGATPADMPASLRDAYLAVAPHPEALPTFVAKCTARMLEFEDWPDDHIRSIAAPTLVLIGDADIIRPEHAVEMFRLLPRAQLAILPGTDHVALVDRDDLLLPILRAFLDAPMPATEGEKPK